eukprot:CAMPEP_0172559068 /NCGR_PEP_ID=MMETSP1067-20121228/82329_1 /TAXON_ID=265564 ORGANISM="Thalassiosira punctigera, Strain Tpunct2005C2" /NCGR_SAMPLE_ID=MMETSP1067 /ASSEMBLY_ACC=CAM_ASM_000444 /LENGTH=310 /DNA_ID=CAMNT_0013348575 /DNA_START=26 /DNA_END=958 /DNA_ORIENTATION=-
MSDADEKPEAYPADYVVPEVWTFERQGGKFGGTNAPTAGARGPPKPLPRGKHPLQLHSMGTPNGQKVTILLEEYVDLIPALEYDAWRVNIFDGDQFGSGFVDANPNSKIPALLDYGHDDSTLGKDEPIRVFESGSVLVYLAEKLDARVPPESRFLPPATKPALRAECLSWLMWQMSTGPTLGGAFGHFFRYAPAKIKYAIDRAAMETKRIFDVLDGRLGGADRGGEGRTWVCGDSYTVADMAIYPWFVMMYMYGPNDVESGIFLGLKEYEHVNAWMERMKARKAVRRGMQVNRAKMAERHGRADFKPEEY